MIPCINYALEAVPAVDNSLYMLMESRYRTTGYLSLQSLFN